MQPFYPPTPETYQLAKKLIENEELVAFPTETIYGLGANALSDVAVQKIFTVKGRPSDNPLIVHLGDKKRIDEYARVENAVQQKIIDTLMPGPLTLLLPKKEWISKFACGVPLVGIRIPSNHVARDFLQAVQLPIAAPSANISWKPSPTTAQMVYDNVGDQIPMIIDGGESEAGIESSVIRVVEKETNWTSAAQGWFERFLIQILRPWFVTKEDLETLFDGQVEVVYTVKNPELSPGMRYKHYSISGEVRIFDSLSDISLSSQSIHSPDIHIWILLTQELQESNPDLIQHFVRDWMTILPRGTTSNLASCAHLLFDQYHSAEQAWINLLFVERLPEEWIGYAIMNRVKRSAGF